MHEVNLHIAGREYKIACGEGQQDYLLDLAEKFNKKLITTSETLGVSSSENFALIMTCINLMDELAELKKQKTPAAATQSQNSTEEENAENIIFYDEIIAKLSDLNEKVKVA